MKRHIFLIVGILSLLIGIAGLIFIDLYSRVDTPWQRSTKDYGPGRMMGPWMRGEEPAREKYSSNGERIYLTGQNESGKLIEYRGGPMWFRMHGGSCATCHGEDGKGGIRMMMTGEISPPITYEDLVEEEHGEEAEEHPPYTDKLIKRAITRGLDPAGESLDPDMPRWKMSEEDLDDLLDYLKTLGSKD